VLQTIKNQNLPSPTDFYTGSLDDAKWYFNYFANPEKISKSTYNAPKDLQLGKIDLYENPETHRCLHIINESRNNISATVIRQLIETSKLGWEKLVPSEIVDYIKENYPKGLIKSLE
jgi:nicotinic acid mononucleotide adenylyltransferase